MPQYNEPLAFVAQTLTLSTTAQVLFGPDITAPAIGLPSNAKTIVFLNLDATDEVYVRMYGTNPGSTPVLTRPDALVIPPNSALTLDIGPVGQRADPYVTGQTTYIQAAAGTPQVSVTLVMCAGALFI